MDIKNKQQQIEEMILDMLNYARTLVNIQTATEDSNFVRDYIHAFRGYATYLVDRNYRKLQEDEIVVPKDEYRYIKDMADRFDPFWFCAFGGCEGVCKECKDTCEMSIFVKERKKFYDKLNENICTFKLENKSEEYKDGYTQAIADICGRLDETAVELGVNIKE